MRIMELEEHLHFSSGFKKCCLVLKDYIQCGSGPTVFARTRLLSTLSTGRKTHLSRQAGGQARRHSFTGPQVESPVPSCVSHLHHSDQQLASCQQGARQTRTPLLSCWAASGTCGGGGVGRRGQKEKTIKALTRSYQTIQHISLSWWPPICHTELYQSVANGKAGGQCLI